MARLRDLSDIPLSTWQKPCTIGYKTTAWYDADGFAVRHHKTNIVTFDRVADTIFVSHGGFMSNTTAQRIRHALKELGLQLLTHDLRHRWRVADLNGNAWTIRGATIKLQRRNNTWSRV